MKNRLKEWREAKGYTQEEFGDLVGKSRSTIIRIEAGQMAFTDKNKELFAKVLEIKPEDFLYIEGTQPAGHIPVKIKGYVQAGNWGEANELDLGEVVMSVSTEYPTTYGLIVKGDSMNLKYPEGTHLTCVPILDYDKDIKSGNSVIVEATCVADEIETTVKEYYRDEEGNNWLLPKSSNPIHQNYPVPNGEDVDLLINGKRIKEINITAIVTGSWKSEV